MHAVTVVKTEANRSPRLFRVKITPETVLHFYIHGCRRGFIVTEYYIIIFKQHLVLPTQLK